MVKFLHLRHVDSKRHEDGKEHPENHGGMTVAYKDMGHGGLYYAVAFCSKNDNFNRSVGRAKAAGRLDSPRYCYEVQDDGVGHVEQRLLREFIRLGLWKGTIWTRQQKPRAA